MRPSGLRDLMTAREAIAGAAARLATVSDTPRLDAELLMAHALGVPRETLILSRLESTAPAAFASLIDRRLAREPVAYIIGHRDFWTISLKVGPGVLVPRPDSETLIEAAISHFAGRADGPQRILDLGTGPGTLLLAALDQWPHATGLGIDASATALDYARRNATALGMATRASFRMGDWAEAMAERFDLILCNPPYIESEADLPPDVADHEPPEALFAGADGLDDYRRIIPMLSERLTGGGVAILEIGSTQCAAVTALAIRAGFKVGVRRDLGGRDRCLMLTPG